MSIESISKYIITFFLFYYCSAQEDGAEFWGEIAAELCRERVSKMRTSPPFLCGFIGTTYEEMLLASVNDAAHFTNTTLSAFDAHAPNADFEKSGRRRLNAMLDDIFETADWREPTIIKLVERWKPIIWLKQVLLNDVFYFKSSPVPYKQTNPHYTRIVATQWDETVHNTDRDLCILLSTKKDVCTPCHSPNRMFVRLAEHMAAHSNHVRFLYMDSHDNEVDHPYTSAALPMMYFVRREATLHPIAFDGVSSNCTIEAYVDWLRAVSDHRFVVPDLGILEAHGAKWDIPVERSADQPLPHDEFSGPLLKTDAQLRRERQESDEL